MTRAAPNIIRALGQRIHELETTSHSHWQRSVPLGIAGLEAVLPEGRLPGGVLLELLVAEPGSGAWTLVVALARAACTDGRGLLIADPQRNFYPPAASVWGIDLKRTLLVRPATAQAALAVVAQALRCSALGLAVGWFDRIGSTDYRRLQLAAETGGGVGLLLRPTTARDAPSFAAARLMITPVPSDQGRRRVAVEALHLRSGKPGSRLILEVDDETHHVRASARVAAPTAAPRHTAAG